MFDFHEKRKIRRVVYSWPVIGVLFLLAAWMGTSVHARFTAERDMAEKLDVRKEELDALHSRAAALEAEVEHLENERGTEEEIRGRFDVVREGEQVVIILDDTETPRDSSRASSTQSASSTSFTERIRHYFAW
jgi:cell division protein FtsB